MKYTQCTQCDELFVLSANVTRCETRCNECYYKKSQKPKIILNIKELHNRIEELEVENERLNNFCKEFVYGEESPEYYKIKDGTIKQLEAENLKLKTCVEFYADKENWQTPESRGLHLSELYADTSDMINMMDSREDNCGGDLARQTLTELKENEK